MRAGRFLELAVVGIFGGTAMYVVHVNARSTVPFTGRRRHRVALSSRARRFLSEMTLESGVGALGALHPLPPTDDDVTLVSRVGARLVRALDDAIPRESRAEEPPPAARVGKTHPLPRPLPDVAHLADVDFRFLVVASPTANAVALSDGTILISAAVLRCLGCRPPSPGREKDVVDDADAAAVEERRRSESALAFVLAHEMAHVVADHAAEGVFASIKVSIISHAIIAGGILALSRLAGCFCSSETETETATETESETAAAIFAPAYGGAVRTFHASGAPALLFHLPRSRAFEFEADRIGLELVVRAGYDPRCGEDFCRRMDENAWFARRRGDAWHRARNAARAVARACVGTHPPMDVRAARMREAAEEMKRKA
jgi:hypothetical protein